MSASPAAHVHVDPISITASIPTIKGHTTLETEAGIHEASFQSAVASRTGMIQRQLGLTAKVQDVNTEESHNEPCKERQRVGSICGIETLEKDKGCDNCCC